jgi:hypothetical protein
MGVFLDRRQNVFNEAPLFLISAVMAMPGVRLTWRSSTSIFVRSSEIRAA